MNRREYERLTETEMKGRRWRTVRPIASSQMEVPAGTEVRIVRKFGGVGIVTNPCEHCGVAVRISKVAFDAVEEIR